MSIETSAIHLGQGSFLYRAKALSTMAATIAGIALLGNASGRVLSPEMATLACIPLVALWFWGLEAYSNRGHADRDVSAIYAVICAACVAWLAYCAMGKPALP